MTLPGWRRLFRLAIRPRTVEREVDAELDFHLQTETDTLAARGMDRTAARLEAERRFGDLDRARETLVRIDRQRLGRERRAGWLEDLRQDVEYAPTFSVVALVLIVVASVASLVPAWRASRVDPNLALRAE